MKTHRILLVLFTSLLPLCLIAESPVFSVRVGPKLQSSQIGIQFGSIQPYIGLDFLSIGLDASLKETYYYTLTDSSHFIISDKNSSGVEGNVRIWMPHAGIRYYLNNNKTKPYLFAGIFKAFPAVDAKTSYDVTFYNEQGGVEFTVSETENLDKPTKDMLEDLLGIWGMNFGFGAEYTVNEHFSIGGEFGFKLARTSINNTAEEISSMSNYYWYYYYGYYYYYLEDFGDIKTVTETDVNAGLTFSYAAISLNFHF